MEELPDKDWRTGMKKNTEMKNQKNSQLRTKDPGSTGKEEPEELSMVFMLWFQTICAQTCFNNEFLLAQ